MADVVQVDGLAQLVAALDGLVADLDDPAEAYAAIAGVADAQIRAATPRRTGRLAGSGGPVRRKGKAVVLMGGPSAPYARIVRARQDFIARAEQQYTPAVVRRLEEEINRAIERRGLHQ